LKSTHAIVGLFAAVLSVMLGGVGAIVLHPDFGMDNTNQVVRTMHAFGARVTLMLAWFAAVMGLNQMTNDSVVVATYAIPLLIFVPITLL